MYVTIAGVAVGLFLIIGAAHAEAPSVVAQSTENPAQVPAVDPTDKNQPPSTPVTQAAAKAGLRSCLNRIEQFTKYLTAPGQAGVFLFTASEKSDQRVFSASMEVLLPTGSVYASSSFAPVGTDGCGALYETVSWWPNSCGEVAIQAFAQLRPANKLARNIQVLAGEKTLRVFLMPAGPGCVSIKKEVVF